MHDLSNLIKVLGTFISVAVTLIAVMYKSHKEDTKDIISNLTNERKKCLEIKSETDKLKEY